MSDNDNEIYQVQPETEKLATPPVSYNEARTAKSATGKVLAQSTDEQIGNYLARQETPEKRSFRANCVRAAGYGAAFVAATWTSIEGGLAVKRGVDRLGERTKERNAEIERLAEPPELQQPKSSGRER